VASVTRTGARRQGGEPSPGSFADAQDDAGEAFLFPAVILRSANVRTAVREEGSGRRASCLVALFLSVPILFTVAAPASAQGTSEIPSSVALAPSGKLEGAFANFGGPMRGKTIRVDDFVYKAPRTRSDLDAEIRPKDLGKALADAFVAEVGAKLKPAGSGVARGAGDLRLTGTVTKYLQPRKAAAWGGWVGNPSGEGEIQFEMKIADSAGKILAAIRHRIALPPTVPAAEAIRAALRDDVAPFLLEASR
jgi:hypothetical protein